MANAQVEKLKALGMRHGEKAAVAIAGAVFLLLLIMAARKETIQLTPEQVAASAKSAQTNLNRNEAREDILKKLEDDWLKTPGYTKLVDDQAKTSLDAKTYLASRPWVTQEPGAGLIRDQPELIAVTELNAFPGRGGFLVYELDAKGKRIPEKVENAPKKLDTASQKRRSRRRGRNRGGMGMGGMGMGGMPGMGGGGGPENPEQKKARELREKQLKAALAGAAKPEPEKKAAEKVEGAPEEPEKSSKEIDKGYRWVSITGVLDHKKMKANWGNALKFSTAAPNYSHLEVQRQALQSDGSWSDFEDVDLEKNRSIVFNLPEEEDELTPETVRIGTLVDPLPFLKAGYWRGVHVVSLVPKEKLEANKAPESGGGGGGMMGPGGMPGGMMGPGGMGGMGMGGMGGRGGMPGGMAGGMAGMGGMGGMGMGGMGGMGMGGMGGGEDAQDFQKTDADTIMIRSLDFTVEPDTTYRFKVRLIVFNPNYNHEDISPGVDNTSLELQGPWSESSNPVTMPPDVAAYAMAKTPTGPGIARTDLVSFQVARWNPSNGVTVVRNFDAGPGQIIGDPRTTRIPNSEGKPAVSQLVDYNSRQIVLDTAGGPAAIAGVGATGGKLDVPAFSLMLRPDGSVMLRNQAFDMIDPVRKDISDNYKREIDESGKARESSMGGMGGMMGGMSGMMGGGMPGMGGMMGGGRR